MGLSCLGREMGRFQCWWVRGPVESVLPLVAYQLGVGHCGLFSFWEGGGSIWLRTLEIFLVDLR